MATDTPKTCLCGCGAVVKARFLPGHDSKLKSRLINVALSDAPARERRTAEKQIAELGWTALLEKSRESRASKAPRPTKPSPDPEPDADDA